MTLTKAQIADAICNQTGIPKWRSDELVDFAFEVIKETLESGEDVLISGFGKWSVKEKGERRGRNPQTGEPIMLAPRKVVKFECGSALRDPIRWEEVAYGEPQERRRI
ncbi:MAG: integration host factor subunit alpha [Deltaproteobacteria bacterium]|nr:MAG: integration host factor subunit alpha [Deltaproteobacteria bacterium]